MKMNSKTFIVLTILVAGIIFFFARNKNPNLEDQSHIVTNGQHTTINQTFACPTGNKNAKILEGECSGAWTVSFDDKNKISKCSFDYAVVNCPDGAKPLGFSQACEGRVDQYTEKKMTMKDECETQFSKAVLRKYRLVCC